MAIFTEATSWRNRIAEKCITRNYARVSMEWHVES